MLAFVGAAAACLPFFIYYHSLLCVLRDLCMIIYYVVCFDVQLSQCFVQKSVLFVFVSIKNDQLENMSRVSKPKLLGFHFATGQ